MKLNKYLLILCIALLIGCGKKEPEGTPVARLENKTLSIEEIRAHLDTTNGPSAALIQQYIQQWLIEESLYREALAQGLDKEEYLNQKLEEVKRRLVINALLEREVYAPKLSNISEQEIQNYYNANKDEFRLSNDVALISYVLFNNRDAATEFRNLILKGTSWYAAVAERFNSIILQFDSSYQTQATLLPAELWRVASFSNLREPSFPINTNNGYYVLIVWKYSKQGQVADLPFVEKEIRSQLTIKRRQKLYNQLVQTLRGKFAVEVYIDTAYISNKNNTSQ